MSSPPAFPAEAQCIAVLCLWSTLSPAAALCDPCGVQLTGGAEGPLPAAAPAWHREGRMVMEQAETGQPGEGLAVLVQAQLPTVKGVWDISL